MPCLRPAFCDKNKENDYSEYLVTCSRNTYGSHGVNPPSQVASHLAPFGPLNWHNLALLLSKHGQLEILCHENNLLFMGPAPCHV